MSEEDQKLQQRIMELAGQINRHKQEQQGNQSPRSKTYFPNTPYAYQRGRGRGGKFGAAPAHRHRTLVLNNSSGANGDVPKDGATDPPQSPGGSSAWVRKRDGRTNQIINKSVYSQFSQQRALDMEETYRLRQRVREEREKAKLNSFVHSSGSNSAVPKEESIITILNTQFKFVDGGNKLVRVSDDPTSAKSTPKNFKVAGVQFVRSKTGNLYRKGYIKANKKFKTKKSGEPCLRFSSTGSCTRGRGCRHIHDPAKVAVCRDLLQKGTCALGDACDLSHDLSPNRVPHCLHFLRGNCTNENCRYAHIRVNPAAPVCRAFATLGYCEKGPECTERHVFECPDYANTGTCRNKKCRLLHVDRAGQLRRAATATATGQSTPSAEDDESSDPSSEEDYDEIDSEDIDSDGLSDDDIYMAGTDGPVDHALSQQHDFIQL